MRPGLLVEGETMARNVRETDTQAGVERRCFTCRERGHTLLDSESVSRCRSVLFHRTSVPKVFPGSHRATRARSRTPRRRRAGPEHLAPKIAASRGVRQPPTRNHTFSVDRVKRQAGICPPASRSPRRVPWHNRLAQPPQSVKSISSSPAQAADATRMVADQRISSDLIETVHGGSAMSR